MQANKHVLIFGATGNMGGATARELLKRGWQVRAVTRNPESEKARDLAKRGAEVVQADMADRTSLDRVFEGMKRVFSVQNWTQHGTDGEIRQGKGRAHEPHCDVCHPNLSPDRRPPTICERVLFLHSRFSQ